MHLAGPRPPQLALQGPVSAGSWHQPDQLPRGPAAPRRAEVPQLSQEEEGKKEGYPIPGGRSLSMKADDIRLVVIAGFAWKSNQGHNRVTPEV